MGKLKRTKKRTKPRLETKVDMSKAFKELKEANEKALRLLRNMY